VMVFLHTSIDPLPVMALLQTSPPKNYRWVMWPVHHGPETAENWKDERSFLLRFGAPSPDIEAMLLSVLDRGWLATAITHLRAGGRILIAADAPFDGGREATDVITVGQAQLPLTPVIETLARVGKADLRLLLPQPAGRQSWQVNATPVNSVGDLTERIGGWIQAHPLDWAGWPFLTARRQMSQIRERRDGSS
jgi:hypothetical protein